MPDATVPWFSIGETHGMLFGRAAVQHSSALNTTPEHPRDNSNRLHWWHGNLGEALRSGGMAGEANPPPQG